MTPPTEEQPDALAITAVEALVRRIVDRAESNDEGYRRVSLLMTASRSVTQELELTAALQRIIEVARELVGARYGALGVIAPDGGLERFVHSGLTNDQVHDLGAPPTGRGILGAVISDGHSIRLDRLADDHRSVGFPPHHPPMASFLGVPIHVDGAVFGNLYLTEHEAGPFNDLDEAIIATLAGMAGTAIANSRLYEQSQDDRRWLAASERLNRRLLSGELGPDDLADIVETAQSLADAAAVVLVARSTEGVLLARHDDPHGDPGVALELDELMAALRELVLSSDISAVDEVSLPTLADPGFGPLLVVPLQGADDRSAGALLIVRHQHGHAFSVADRETVARFARSVAIARDLARTNIDEQRIALADERDRIARDLHDHVIQSLFAVGLTMQSIVGDPSTPMGARIANQVEAIDSTIRQIRQAIYRLSSPPNAMIYSLRARINVLVRETLEGEQLDSRLDFSGPVDTLVDAGLGDEVAAVIREALSNSVRHAQATTVHVSVAVRGADVTLSVTDDGIGMPETSRRSGLANLDARAHERGGTLTIRPVNPHGTEVLWVVPWEAR